MTTRGSTVLRNTPTWQGYLVCWVVAATVFIVGVFAVLGAFEGDLEEWSEMGDVVILLVAYFVVTLVVSGLGLLPVAVVVHVLLRDVEAQWVHVVAFGLAISAVFGVAFAFAEPLLGFAGLAPGAAAGVGRLVAAHPRFRQEHRSLRPRTGW